MVLETVKLGLHLGVTRTLGPQGPPLAGSIRRKAEGSLEHPPCPPHQGEADPGPSACTHVWPFPSGLAVSPRASGLTPAPQALQFWAQPGWTGPDAGLEP